MYKRLTFENVRFGEGFLPGLIEVNRRVTIPAEYEKSRETGRIDAFRLQWKPGSDLPKPHIFWDSDVAKWVEAASCSLATHYDAELDRKLDEVAGLIVSSQQPDGYINSHYTAVEPQNRFTNLRDCHELYCCGHLIEAAAAHFRATGKRTLLDAVCRYADYLTTVFGAEDGMLHGYPGHEEIELALVKLYELTGEKKYLRLSQYFIDQRGQSPNFFVREAENRGEDAGKHPFSLETVQAHAPVREQTRPVGHSVRAMYLYSAMADLARINGDRKLFEACERIWDSLTGEHMYITGGIGAAASNEGFQRPLELPNAEAYCETCAAVGLVFFASRMLAFSCDSRYGDVMERALYNGVISGVSEGGDRFFYANPLESVPYRTPFGADSREWYRRSEWFGCACCPSNLSRLLASAGSYFVTYSDTDAALHLYDNMTAVLPYAEITCRTEYPRSGKIRVFVKTASPRVFTLRLRIPGWCDEWDCTIPGKVEKGYLAVKRRWSGETMLELELEMKVKRNFASPLVRADAGCTALSFGPRIFCVEDADYGFSVQLLRLPDSSRLSYDGRFITGKALKAVPDPGAGLYSDRPERTEWTPFRALPYHLWANREPGGMKVFIPRVKG